MYASEKLAAFVCDLGVDRLSSAVVDKARLCLTDALGCLVAAHKTPAGDVIREFVRQSGEAGKVRVVGSDLRTSAGMAAFAHATLINALDFDDIYEKGHPGATAIGAAIGLAQELGASEPELLAALVAGYEVGCRIGISMVHTQPRKFLHGHGTWQALGAAAAAARLLKLTPRQAAHALAIAAAKAPVASVMKTVYGAKPSMAKNNFGAAAQTGVNAARLAAAGFEGPLDIFEGDTGFWRMFGADAVDANRLTAGLGRDYEILRVGFKPYSTCRLVQSSVEASLAVFAAAKVAPDGGEVERLVISGAPILTQPPFSCAMPADMWAAQFSAPYAVALALLGVEPGPQWFEDASLHDPRVRAVAAKIELKALPADERPDAHHHPAKAELHLRDGRLFAHFVAIAKGDAANPLPASFVEEKFFKLTGLRSARALIESIDA
jgi:2-methylcitrate dehydratase PrpD